MSLLKLSERRFYHGLCSQISSCLEKGRRVLCGRNRTAGGSSMKQKKSFLAGKRRQPKEAPKLLLATMGRASWELRCLSCCLSWQYPWNKRISSHIMPFFLFSCYTLSAHCVFWLKYPLNVFPTSWKVLSYFGKMCYDSIYSVDLPRVWWCLTHGPERLLKILIDLHPDKGNSGLNIADSKLPVNTLWPVECELHEGLKNNTWHTVGLCKCL